MVLVTAAALLAGCVTPTATIEHRDEAGLWTCPATAPGECILLEPSHPTIDWGEWNADLAA